MHMYRTAYSVTEIFNYESLRLGGFSGKRSGIGGYWLTVKSITVHVLYATCIASILCKEPDGKCFRLSGPESLCHNHSGPVCQGKSNHSKTSTSEQGYVPIKLYLQEHPVEAGFCPWTHFCWPCYGWSSSTAVISLDSVFSCILSTLGTSPVLLPGTPLQTCAFLAPSTFPNWLQGAEMLWPFRTDRKDLEYSHRVLCPYQQGLCYGDGTCSLWETSEVKFCHQKGVIQEAVTAQTAVKVVDSSLNSVMFLKTAYSTWKKTTRIFNWPDKNHGKRKLAF